MQADLDIARYVALLKRRAWLIAMITMIGTIAAVFASLVLEPKYKASATIQVLSQEIPQNLANSLESEGVSERLVSMHQRLMTPNALSQIGAKFDLFAKTPDMSLRDRAEHIESSTEITPLTYRKGAGGAQITSFRVSYTASDPAVAADVANEIVDIVVRENEDRSLSRASVTTSFFEQQLELTTANLNALEEEIAEFKRQNDERLPDTLGLRREVKAELGNLRFEIELRIAELTRTITMNAQRLSDEAYWANSAEEDAPPQTPLEQDLRALELEYKTNLNVFSEVHPDMRKMKAQIEALKVEVERGQGVAAKAAEGDYTFAQRRQREEIRDVIDAASAEIETLKRRLIDIDVRETPFTSSIAETPEIERQMNILLRRKEGLQAKHDETVQKLAEAELGAVLTLSSKGERFDVIDAAEAPTSHFKPKRKLIVLAGAGLSLGFALVLVLGLDLLNGTIRSDEDFYRQLDAHAFAMVPYVRTGRDRARSGAGILLGVAFTASTLLLSVYAIDRYFMPLDPYLDRVFGESGIIHTMTVINE